MVYSKYPDISFGLLTGDIKYNQADIDYDDEILRNTLFQKTILSPINRKHRPLQFDMDLQTELSCVVTRYHINDQAEEGMEETVKCYRHQLIMFLQ